MSVDETRAGGNDKQGKGEGEEGVVYMSAAKWTACNQSSS